MVLTRRRPKGLTSPTPRPGTALPRGDGFISPRNNAPSPSAGWGALLSPEVTKSPNSPTPRMPTASLFSPPNKKKPHKGKDLKAIYMTGSVVLLLFLCRSWVLQAKNALIEKMQLNIYELQFLYNETSEQLHHAYVDIDQLNRTAEALKQKNALLVKNLDEAVRNAENSRESKNNNSDVWNSQSDALSRQREAAMTNRIKMLQTQIQEISKRETVERFGHGPYYVKVAVEKHGKMLTKETGSFTIELAPLDIMPHSVHLFLQMVAHRLWDDTLLLHSAEHVLQASPRHYPDGMSKLDRFVNTGLSTLSFQEYSDQYRHNKYTVGFAGRPGGPYWYISTEDNSEHHGPGGQAHHDLAEEADPCFGRIVDGIEVVEGMRKMSVEDFDTKPHNFNDEVYLTRIVSARILANEEDEVDEKENQEEPAQESCDSEKDEKNDEQPVVDEEVTFLLEQRREKVAESRLIALHTEIQQRSRRDVVTRFGSGPHFVQVEVEKHGKMLSIERGTFTIELAPLDMMPHSVDLFLQMVSNKLWDDTLLLHSAEHVLQASPRHYPDGKSKLDIFAKAGLTTVSFQEYTDRYPHEKYTVGFAGRPGGPYWYISTDDNSEHHGPGGQGHYDLSHEADPCFGRIVDGIVVVEGMRRMSVEQFETVPHNFNDEVYLTRIVSARIL